MDIRNYLNRTELASLSFEMLGNKKNYGSHSVYLVCV